jgi:hypothetical protein
MKELEKVQKQNKFYPKTYRKEYRPEGNMISVW